MAAYENEALAVVRRTGACLENDHFVFANGHHSGTYINKDAVYPHTAEISRLCEMLAGKFAENRIEVVVGPANGGIILAQWVAHHLSRLTGKEVFAVYGEKTEIIVDRLDTLSQEFRPGNPQSTLPAGSVRLWRTPGFVIRRGYDSLIPGKRCLCVEDILSTGESAAEIIRAVETLDGTVVGLGAIWNRGGVIATAIGLVGKLISLIDTELAMWTEEDCPLCIAGEPINTAVGHGREFLARNKGS